jgi:hypothetical protein
VDFSSWPAHRLVTGTKPKLSIHAHTIEVIYCNLEAAPYIQQLATSDGGATKGEGTSGDVYMTSDLSRVPQNRGFVGLSQVIIQPLAS